MVLEPASGDDAISDVLRAAGCTVYTNDIDPRHPAMWHQDATSPAFWRHVVDCIAAGKIQPVDWVISNYPFNVAFDILKYGVGVPTRGTAVILRKTFLEPTEDRGPWLQLHPLTGGVGLPRHAFRGSGSDSVSCDWMLWEPGRPAAFTIDAFAKEL